MYSMDKYMKYEDKLKIPSFINNLSQLQFKLLRYLMKLTLKGIIEWKDMDNKDIIEYMKKAGYSNETITFHILRDLEDE